MVESISGEGLHAALDDHPPGVCPDGHFECEGCGWHEPVDTFYSWTEIWSRFIDHLTEPVINVKEIN